MDEQAENKNLNPGGRPNLAGEEVLAYRLITRVNERDNEAIQRDFKVWQSGRSGRMADYLREILLNRNKPKVIAQNGVLTGDQVIELTQTLHNIRQHLKHLDTNYNQIARRINSIEHTGKLYYEVQASKATIDKIEPLITQIDSLVKAQTEAFFKK
ncbi:hypothetical protein BN8_p06780 (plasmid) [Fibrisoma limi BUZ 3]|uniref:Bacterial mobilisation domain-containing protein n=1 Tax=Fibrisoma limi BUZ 3 TaxID=1185876 RepID=I2GTY8_9BACT|nr:hypothetical protein [Fibrisoma limi]CCH57589.1 hypothetical protein BN8_p06780 [Fibrisoma limi BUZ 3]